MGYLKIIIGSHIEGEKGLDDAVEGRFRVGEDGKGPSDEKALRLVAQKVSQPHIVAQAPKEEVRYKELRGDSR